MDTKLAMLLMLFGAIIGLSLIGEDQVARVKQQLAPRRWRKAVLGRSKS